MTNLMSFDLHPRLAQDCIHLGDLNLCRVLLMNESRYPWLILVPMRDNLRELMELSEEDAAQFWRESALMQTFLLDRLKAEKLNVAALRNMVPQLHVHHIARFARDAAWPDPVWGKFSPIAYETQQITELQTLFNDFLGENLS